MPVEAGVLPDYIAVAGETDEPIGYVAAAFAWPVIGEEEASYTDEAIPVVDRSLTLIGHMWPGKGFVPVGTGPASVPGVNVTTTHGEAP